jgi:serralysin
LAHPHDGGEEDGKLFPGVTRGQPSDTGDFGLNQGIWTTMGYNDGWNMVPAVSEAYGYQGTPMAFDIAALQCIYGANMTHHTGDDTYLLPTTNGTGITGNVAANILDGGTNGETDTLLVAPATTPISSTPPATR